MAKILLTDNETSSPISLEDGLILKAFTADSITNVEYLSEEDGYRKLAKVTEALASVGGQSKLLISLTEKNSGDTVWINRDRINLIDELSSEAILFFDAAGASLERIKVTETAQAVKEAIITKEGDTVYDLLATGTFTAGPNTISLAAAEGDVTANFTAGVLFTVFGEGDSNDNIYTTVSSAFGTETVITVTETPTAGNTNGGKVWLKA
jgi:hypothetical protein